MPDGIILHREQLPASGTWQVRPPALAGITPIAYIAFGTCVDYPGDDVLAANSGHFVSMGTGSQSYCAAGSHEDALASSNNACTVARDVLLYIVNPSRADSVVTGNVTLVSGGLDVVINQADIQPMVTFLFIYSDTWETFTTYQVGLQSGTAVHPTGFTGTDNDNQLFLVLTDIGATSFPQRDLAGSFVPTIGCAYRQGTAGAPAAQWVMPVTNRDNRSSGEINNRIFTDSVSAAVNNFGGVDSRHSISDISDSSITIAWQEGSSQRRGMFVLGLNTKDKKCWAGIEDALNASGDWVVNTPNFQPEVVACLPNQQTVADGTGKTADIDVGGWIAGTASAESSAIWSFEDGAANMVAKSREDNQFLNVLQDDGSEGWRSGANDFSLTATGFRVDNVVVDGGGGGAPLTTRKWLVWAIEGEPSGPVIHTGTGTLQAQDAAVVGVGEVISPAVITGTGALQAQGATVVGVGDVIEPTVGTGTLQAQDAAVVGVGDVISPVVGTGTLQAQSAQVSGVGAIVHDGSGTLQAQPAAVVGVGEVGNVRTGTGALQAGEAAVVGTGVRVSVGSGTLQAQDADVVGAGVVEGLTSGTGALQAQSAAVIGTGELVRVGSGALQAQTAQVAGVGAILGELTLTPADIAAIADAVYAKLVNEGLVQQINEIWQRRGLDAANPQTYDKANNEIRVGNITIDLSGDPSSVTQTRQP